MTYIKLPLLVSFLLSTLTILLIVLLPYLAAMISVAVSVVIDDEIIVPPHILYPLVLILILDLLEHPLGFFHLHLCQPDTNKTTHLVLIGPLVTAFTGSPELSECLRDVLLASLPDFAPTSRSVVRLTTCRFFFV